MKRKIDDILILKLHGEGKSQRAIAKAVGCSKTAILKRLRKLVPVSGHPADKSQETGVSEQLGGKVTVTPKYHTNQRYIRKFGDERVHIYTDFLMRRGDMEEVAWDGEKFVVVTRTEHTNRY